jgi:hypothetical protein
MPARRQLRHLRVDRRHAPLSRDCNAMVAVDHEIGVAQLVDDDRRKVSLRERLGNSPPPLTDVRPERVELAVEVPAAALGPDDAAQPDRADADVAAPRRAQPLGRLVEGEQMAAHTCFQRSQRPADSGGVATGALAAVVLLVGK